MASFFLHALPGHPMGDGGLLVLLALGVVACGAAALLSRFIDRAGDADDEEPI